MNFDIVKILKMLWLFVIIATSGLLFIYNKLNIPYDFTFYKLFFFITLGYLPYTLLYKYIPLKHQHETLVINACAVTLGLSMIMPFYNHFFLFFIPVLSILIQKKIHFYILNGFTLIAFISVDSHSFIDTAIELLVFLCFIILVRYVGNMIFISIQKTFHFNKMIDALIFAIETKDGYTRGHSLRVAEYAVILGEYYIFLGGKIDLETLRISALLHDVGKVYIPNEILTKSGALTPEEFDKIKHHPKFGADIIKSFDYSRTIVKDILYHHERFDGTGYPAGLVGREIPINARILAIADTFDALTSTRSYRVAYSADEARDIILKNFGSQFDPDLRRCFEFAYPVFLQTKSKLLTEHLQDEIKSLTS
jgi:putative nucleotidyltransferase with HDIG domain